MVPSKQEPLALAYEWRTRLMWVMIPIALIVVYMLVSRPAGGLYLLLFGCVMGAMVMTSVYFQTRAHFQVLGEDATVRRFFGTTTVHGPDVVKVREIINGRSPDVQLVLSSGRRVTVPTSRLAAGHSTLFDWLAEVAPGADYDKGAQRIQNILDQKRGIA